MVNGSYYDGHSARRYAVTLSIAQGKLEIRGEGVMREVPLTNLRISTKLGSAPRLLHFAEGGHCEVSRHTDFETLSREAGVIPLSCLSRLESSWSLALTAVLLTIAIAGASIYWGLPWLANLAAARVPVSVTITMDAHFLSAVDNGLMQASTLNAARQQALRLRFDGLRNVNGLPPHHLEFRSSKAIGANAFALPGGTIIVTDQLIDLAGNDEEILGVLAHELGHVSERHPLRQLLQSSAIGLAMTWYIGDISNLLAVAPTLLLESNYSRNFERSADRYAAGMLRMNEISPAHLADMLEKLELSHLGVKRNNQQSFRITQFFSTHPDTEMRVRNLRSDDAQSKI